MFNLDPTLALVEQLRAAGIRAALAPASVNLPGVWVQVAAFAPYTMGTFSTSLRLQLLASDTDARRAMDALVDLAQQVRTVIPYRDATARTVLMPDGTGLPGLEVRTTVNGPITIPEGAPAP